MALRLKTTDGKTDLMKSVFALRENPFSQAQIYKSDQPGTYVPEMYGDQLDAFYKRFFVMPLMKDTNKQVIGAIWSSHTGDSMGKGFGKSMLMAEESKRINADFGATLLRRSEVVEEDISENPFLAGYCTFDQAKDVKTFPLRSWTLSPLFLRAPTATTRCIRHFASGSLSACRHRRATRGKPSCGLFEPLCGALVASISSLRIKRSNAFSNCLPAQTRPTYVDFIRHEIGPRIKAAQGFNFVHVFNAFVSLAGIVYVAYFIDQIENFARFVSRQDREIKILRESMCQTSPTADMASFIFQMHINAQEAIEDLVDERASALSRLQQEGERNSHHRPPRLGTEGAYTLAARYLADFRITGAKVSALPPFQRRHPRNSRSAAEGTRATSCGHSATSSIMPSTTG